MYNSGPDESWTLTPEEYWDLFNAAHLYIVPVLMMHCEVKLSEHAETLTNDVSKLIDFINKAQTLSISEKLSKIGLDLIKKDLYRYYKNDSKSLNKLGLNAMKDVVKDLFLKMTEGEVFDIAVKWSQANTENHSEAKKMFEDKFLDKFDVPRISQQMFLEIIGPSDFLPIDVYKEWSMEVMRNNVDWSTRQDFNGVQVRVMVSISTDNNRHFTPSNGKLYTMRKNESFRKIIETASKDFKVPARSAKFFIAYSFNRVHSDNYIRDFRESLSLFEHYTYIDIKLRIQRGDQH